MEGADKVEVGSLSGSVAEQVELVVSHIHHREMVLPLGFVVPYGFGVLRRHIDGIPMNIVGRLMTLVL